MWNVDKYKMSYDAAPLSSCFFTVSKTGDKVSGVWSFKCLSLQDLSEHPNVGEEIGYFKMTPLRAFL